MVVGEMDSDFAGVVGGDGRIELSLFVHPATVHHFALNTASLLSTSDHIDHISHIATYNPGQYDH
jgi:hypothetical protein